jgi:hypothetical protein
LARATRSATVFAGCDGVITRSSGTEVSSDTGAKSSGVLKGILGWISGLTACAKAPSNRMPPSGVPLATTSSPIMPAAPGRLSITTVTPSASCSFGWISRAVVSAPPPGE